MIQFSDVGLLRGTKRLLQAANATLYPGHKAGLIGGNGCGKSSIFALIRGEFGTDEGELSFPSQWRIAAVAQETPSSTRTAIEYVLDGDKHFRQLQASLAAAESCGSDGVKIADLHTQLEQAGAYDIESRAASILHGLGFNNEACQRKVSEFSGGWRMRLNLAQALICPSDLLLLDEPTNHLDLDAVIWLERWLQRYPGTLLLISHDQAFLDATVNEIISVEQQQLITYSGNYSAFEKQRAERLRLQTLEYQKQQDKIAHLQSFITRFKAKASKAKQAQSRVKQLEKMETLLPAHHASPFSFSFLAPPKLPNPLVMLDQVQAGYGDTVILSKVQLNLVPGSRIGLLGRNGAGKSTLIKLLAEEHPPISGDYQTSSGLNVGYFAQHQLDYLSLDDSALTHLQRLAPKETEQSLRDFLGGFGFHGDEALKAVKPMSGGEKARLVLALIVYQKPNLLLLDEPTNHLDLEMRHALNIALQSFEGAMVLISHDRFLLSSVCDDFYLVNSGQVTPFSGDLDDYRQWLTTDTQNTQTSVEKSPQMDKKTRKRLEAEFRQTLTPLKKQVKASEAIMDKCQHSLAEIEEQLSDVTLYNDDNKAKLKDLLKEQSELKNTLEDAEMQWMEAQEHIEQAQLAFDDQMDVDS